MLDLLFRRDRRQPHNQRMGIAVSLRAHSAPSVPARLGRRSASSEPQGCQEGAVPAMQGRYQSRTAAKPVSRAGARV